MHLTYWKTCPAAHALARYPRRVTVDGTSVVIPVFNAAPFLEDLTAILMKTLLEMGKEFEVILVNDHSTDTTGAIANQLCEKYSALKVLHLPRHRRKYEALRSGIESAKMNIIVTLDDDLEHPPEAIPALMAEIEGGHDLVYARSPGPNRSKLRELSSRLALTTLSRVAGLKAHPSPFRAFRREIYGATGFEALPLDLTLQWLSKSPVAISTQFDRSRRDRSSYGFLELLGMFLELLWKAIMWRIFLCQNKHSKPQPVTLGPLKRKYLALLSADVKCRR